MNEGARLGPSALAFVGCLAFLGDARAQPERTLDAADHALDLRRDDLVVDTTWVLARALGEGELVPLASGVPDDARVLADGFDLERSSSGGLALRARRAFPDRARVAIRTEVPRRSALEARTLPVPTVPDGSVQRVRCARSVRFEAGEATSLGVAAGIQVGTDVRRADRRRAEAALDGRRSHRRLGALYVRARPEGVEGSLVSVAARQRGLAFVAGMFFLVAAGGVWALHRRAQRAVDAERVDAYLAANMEAEGERTPTG